MNVKKTPVSILQEMMQKGGSPPSYEIISNSTGSHENIFTYKVTCSGLIATGTGRNKKDAKHEAAKAMLEKIVEVNALPQLPASPCETPVRTPLPKEIPIRPKSPINIGFKNSVGELGDLCTFNNLDNPVYNETGDIGPPHARIFTVTCTVSTFVEEGTASTKKQAKHEAARKMIDKLKDVISEDLVINTLTAEAALEELSRKKALLKYPELSVSNTPEIKSKKNWRLKIIEFHKNIKNLFEEELRCKVVEKLENLLVLAQECKKDTYSESSLMPVRKELEYILEPLEYKFHLLKYKTYNKSTFLTGIKITTCPDIQEVGIGQTEGEAECLAIIGALNSLIFFIR